MHFLRVGKQGAKEEAQALDSNERQVCLIAYRSRLGPFGVQSKRDGTAYYVSEVSECEPGRDIASAQSGQTKPTTCVGTFDLPSLMVLRITGCDSSLDTPEKPSTYAACDRTEVHEPRSSGPVVDIQASGIEWVSNASKSQRPPESNQIGQPRS